MAHFSVYNQTPWMPTGAIRTRNSIFYFTLTVDSYHMHGLRYK